LRDLVKVIKVLYSEPKPVEPINNKNSKRRVVFFFIWVSYEFTLVSSLLKIKGIKKEGKTVTPLLKK